MEMKDYHRASNALVFGGLVTYVAGLMLLMAFTSPYWLESYEETFSEFKNMGLWTYCFSDYRHPAYQFPELFNGCHHVFSDYYYVIREWLLPPWLMAVQGFVTIGLLYSFSSQAIIALVLIRWPLQFVLRYEWILSSIACVFNAITAVSLFMAVSVFGGQCWRRDWLMYPNFNHLSWSYAFAVISFMFHAFAAFFLYLDARMGYKMRVQSRNLVMQMHPTPQSHHGMHRTGYI
ncbi:uncharacterized protein LOC124300404 [Neodiprion virginianus]|uniref:uncharacterized protein LOC124300404 n=1 Tax=Neodiprion virginianus TaxID=2961670 RepID=UPI001EE72E25|nr:uncharacterized protein LOC124300404 [Neodiprion virginianus]